MPVYIQHLKSGTSFYIHGSVLGRQYTIRGFKTKKDAEDYEEYFIESQSSGHRKNMVHFNTLLKTYYSDELVQWKMTTVYSYRIKIKRYIFGVFPNIPLSQITYDHVFKWFKTIRDLFISKDAKLHLLNIFKSIFLFADKKYDVDLSSYFNKLPRLPDNIVRPRKRVVFTVEQFWIMVSYIQNYQIFCFVVIMFFTGLRESEVRGLTWIDAFNLDERRIEVFHQAASKLGLRKTVFITPKSHNSIRSLAMPDIVHEFSKVLYHNQESGSMVFPSSRYPNTPLGVSTVRRAVDDACLSANLPQIDLHEIRHSYASFMSNMLKVSAQDISTALGHSTKSTTEYYYLHSYDSAQKAIADKVNKYLEDYFKKGNN